MENAKEYLSQAYFLDARINSNIAQVDGLHTLATKVTATFSDMPKPLSGDPSRVECTVLKIYDLENEIDREIDRLVDLKRDLLQVIQSVSKPEYQMVLQKRYIEMEKWDVIAQEMALDVRWVQRLHGRALEEVQKYLDDRFK
jgi:DNA-directed RNA polymerase specialized sigma24 family protein